MDDVKIVKFTRDQLREIVAEAVANWKGLPRTSPTQLALQAAIEMALAEDEIELANAMLVLDTARIAGDLHRYLTLLMSLVMSRREAYRTFIDAAEAAAVKPTDSTAELWKDIDFENA